MKKSPLALTCILIAFCSTPAALAQNDPHWDASRVFGIGSIYSLSYSPDGAKLLMAGVAGAQLWDVETWSVEREFLGHQGVVQAATWSPDQSKIATASD